MARNRYLGTIRKWNWEAIHEEAMGTLEDDPENPGQRVGRSFLGTVFGLTPSGKYYQPWACGNVDPCPRCKGSGRAKRAVACEWCGGSGWRSLAHLAEARGESVEATVVFLGNQDHPVRINHRDGLFACSACNATGLRHNDCNWCSGTGSREAYLDPLGNCIPEAFVVTGRSEA